MLPLEGLPNVVLEHNFLEYESKSIAYQGYILSTMVNGYIEQSQMPELSTILDELLISAFSLPNLAWLHALICQSK